MSLSVEKNLRKAQSHLKAGEFAEAETLYKAILLKLPKNKKAIEGYQRVNSGVTAHKSPSFEPPQDQIQALLRLYHKRQFQDLFANAENLARQCPNSVLIYNILGMANASLQNSEAAIWNFQQAINAKPDYAESHYNLGISLQTIGKIDAAISSFQRAIKIKPDHFASRMYDDLMTFWYAHYGDRIYQLDYDQLTVKQEDETIKLIDHIGLDWESVCLSPHKNKRGVHTASQQQVRKEVYTGSSSQWRKFEPFLGGVFDGLSGPSTRSLET